MGEWSIYGSNGSVKAVVKKLEYSGEFMGETIVTCDVYSASPINFDVGDYLDYRGERFAIDYNATRKKQARTNTYGKGFVYEGMRFTNYIGELKKCEFLDFVPSDNQVHYSQLPEFSFFAADVSDLAERIQANLDRLYTGNKAWTVSVTQGFGGKTNIDVQVSKITCFDALKLAYDQFEAQFVIRGRTITIGTAGSTLETNYTYGKGNGLKTIERSVDESDALITRLRAYGNTTNMPANYYRNLNTLCYADYYETLGPYADKGADLHFHPGGNKFANNWFTEKSGADAGHYWVEVSLDEELWITAIASTNASNGSVGFSVVSTGMYGSNTQDMLEAFNTQLGSTGRLYFRKGVSYDNWGAGKESGSSVPASLFIDRLMLPSFPTNPDPYIDSSNIGTLGIREKSVYFDGSDPELPDIHPSLEGMTAHDIDPVHGSSSDYLDEIAADATEIGGGDITTDGQFVNMDEVPGFQVKVKDIGFDINSYLSTETATLSMKSGKCGGREFTIVKVEKAVGGGYLLTCQRTEDINLYFPYKDYPIEAGDKFVLTGIEMPEIYVTAASNRLLAAAQEYLDKHSQPQYVYAIKMDDIWMQRQADGCESVGDSYYWNIKEGDVMQVQDNDLGIYEGTPQNPTPISEVIDRLTIREGYDPILQIDVVLRKEKPQGTIGILQNRIRQLEAQNAEQVKTINRQNDYITLVLGDRINDIANQADHQQISWFGTNTPNVDPDNPAYPIDQWTDDWSNHIGDMYYDKDGIAPDNTPIGYVFEKNNNSYQWTVITDPHTLQALAIASEDKDTIDGKRRVFVISAGDVPLPPYEVGDLWVNAIYPSNNTVTDEAQHKYYNDVLKCITDRGKDYSAAANVRINDWSLASKYTDDSKLNNFLDGYSGTLTTIANQIDQKAETWYQSTDPSTGWDAGEKEMHEGDIWYNTTPDSNGNCHTYIYRKSGSNYNWEEINGVPEDLFDTVDGKAAIYVSWNAWMDGSTNNLHVRDLLIPASNITKGGVTYYANKVYRCTNKSTPTFQEIDYTDDAALNAFLNGYTGTLTNIRGDITNAQNTANAAEAIAAALEFLGEAYRADDTLIDHGLILSTIVALRDSNNKVWSGISGAYKSSETGTGYKGHGIAAWYGGGMADWEVYKENNSSATISDTYAKSLFRFDGSGYVASGNLSWDASGKVTIQGYSIDATTLQVGGKGVATTEALANYLPLAGGTMIGTINSQIVQPKTNNAYTLGGSSNRWSNVYSVLGNFSGSVTIANSVTLSGDTTAKKRITFGSGNTAGYIEYDASTGLFHFSKGLYSDGTVSALGANSQGGGGTGIELDAVWASLTNNDDDFANSKININHIPVSVTGSGNVLVNATISNNTLTITKGNVPTATSSAIGGIMIGYTTDTTNKNYAVQLSSSKAYVNVPWTDTKNTAGGDNTSSKIFLVGLTAQTTSNGTARTYSHDTVYIGTDGHLYSNSKQVVNLSDTQALTNKTYNGYTLAAACAKGVVTTLDTSANLPTANAVSTALSGALGEYYTKTEVNAFTWWGQSISDGKVDGTITINGGEIQIWNLATATSSRSRKDMRFLWGSNDVFQMWAYEGAYYDLCIGTITTGVTSNKPLYFDASVARWGIGTDTPDTTLHIVGTLKATSSATASTLTLSNTDGVRHLNFSRTSYNYISAPAGSDINFEFSKSSLSHSDVAVSIKDTGLIILANRTLKIGNAVLSWDSTNNCIKISDGTANDTTKIGIYATGTVSALGANTSGGGGTGIEMDEVWAALHTYEQAANHDIDARYLKTSFGTGGNAVANVTISNGVLTTTKDYFVKTVQVSGTGVVTGFTLSNGTLTLTKENASSKALANYYSSRQSDMNIDHVNNGGVWHFIGASSASNRPNDTDAHLLHFHWDTTYAYDAQLALTTGVPTTMYIRSRNGSNNNWGVWKKVLDSSDYDSKTANTVLAAPNGSNGTATFRALVAADIPDIYLRTASATNIQNNATSSNHYDLDLLKSVGTYAINNNANAAYFDNRPYVAAKAFRIVNFRPRVGAATGSDYLTQRFQYYNESKVYERYYYTSGSPQWSSWYKVQDNLDSLDGYLPLDGSKAMTGILNTCRKNGMWIVGKTQAAIMYNSGTPLANASTSEWLFNMVSSSGNTIAFGGLKDTIGFYGWLSDRTANGTDWSTSFNTGSGVLTISSLGSGSNLVLSKTSTTSEDYPAQITFNPIDSTTGKSTGEGNCYIRAYNDHSSPSGQSVTNGANMVIRSGGNIFIGGGEAAQNHYNAIKESESATTLLTQEKTYITSDNNIYLQSNAGTVANRVGFYVSTAGNLIPCAADSATSRGSIGTNDYKWSTLYISTSVKIGNCVISWDSTNSLLKFSTGIYSEGTVSALGANSDTSGGGGADIADVWDSLTNTTGTSYSSTTKIHSDHINITATGDGNAVTGVTPSGTTITLNKGTKFLPLTAGSGNILTGSLYLNNNLAIFFKDTNGTARNVLQLNNSNNLHIGAEASTGFNTYISGKIVFLRYLNSSNSTLTAGLSLNQSGLVTISKNLTVSGTSTLTGAVTASSTITASGNITGLAIIKKDGTSTQFLKADGSVDSNTYLTADDGIVGTEATSNANRRVWFSYGTTTANEKKRGYNTNFMYNPSTNTITANAATATEALRLPYSYVYGGGTGGGWWKAATCSTTSSGIFTSGATFYVSSQYYKGSGILEVLFRKESNATTYNTTYTRLRWVCRDSTINPEHFKLVVTVNSSTNMVCDLYFYQSAPYGHKRFYKLDDAGFSAYQNYWQMTSVSAAGGTLPTESATTPIVKHISCTDESYASNAGKLNGVEADGYVTITGAQKITGVKTFDLNTLIVNGGEADSSNNYSTIQFSTLEDSTYYTANDSAVYATLAALRNSIRFNWYSSTWAIGNVRSGDTNSAGFAIGYMNSGKTHVQHRFLIQTNGNILTNASITAGSEVTASSDERSKTVKGDTRLTVYDIASAPSIKFLWNDKRDERVHIGSIAQYWEKALPEAVSYDNNGIMSLNYGALALVSAITIARELLKFESRVAILERENKKLKERITALERSAA